MKRLLSIPEINALDEDAFVELLGGVYEHSPWVARQVYSLRPFNDAAALAAAMRDAVEGASQDTKLALLREHPRLGLKAEMTDLSQSEQAGSGLLTSPEDQERALAGLNDAYEEKFRFPFIVAVRGLGVGDIIATCEERLGNDRDTEFAEGLSQVFRIAGFRLADIIADQS